MALASTSDVEVALGRSLTAEEATRAAGLLTQASVEVERYTGFRFTAGDYTIARTALRGRVAVPAADPTVAEVRLVDCDGGAEVLTDWTLRRRTLYLGRSGDVDVEVDFTVAEGAEVPAEVVGVVAAMVARSVTQTPDEAATVTQAGLGSAQVSYTSNTSGGSVWMAKADKLLLSRYRRPRGPILLVRG